MLAIRFSDVWPFKPELVEAEWSPARRGWLDKNGALHTKTLYAYTPARLTQLNTLEAEHEAWSAKFAKAIEGARLARPA